MVITPVPSKQSTSRFGDVGSGSAMLFIHNKELNGEDLRFKYDKQQKKKRGAW